MSNQEYIITASFTEAIGCIALAGFNADDQNESIMSRHLFNVCKQSNGQFLTTQHLINNVVQQWQNLFCVSAMQLLKTAPFTQQQTIQKINLYKMEYPNSAKLINTFKL